MVDLYTLKIASEKLELIQDTLAKIDEVVVLISAFTSAEENKTLLSSLLANITDVKQIIGSVDLMQITTEDIEKGTYLGNRKTDIDIALNKTGIAGLSDYTAIMEAWNTTTNTVYYDKAICTFVDGTILTVNFVNDDSQGIQVSTHGSIIDQLNKNQAFTDKLENTSIIEEVGGKTGTLIRIADVTGKSSNVERIQLHAVSGDFVSADPIYYWALTTSALQTLANRVGDIISLGNDIDKIIILSSSIDEMLALQNALAQLLTIHANLTDILASKANADSALASKNAAAISATSAATSATAAANSATSAANSATVATTKADEIKTITVGSTTTAVAGTLASVTYNAATGKFNFVIPTGATGAKGDPFTINAEGTIAQRSTYDTQPRGFSFLALDESLVYFKNSATSGDWSIGAPFGKGDKGDTGNGIGAIDFTSTTDASGHPAQSGAVDTYTITFTDATTTTFTVYNGADGHTPTKEEIGLGNVDNTSDADKPISTAAQAKFDEVETNMITRAQAHAIALCF